MKVPDDLKQLMQDKSKTNKRKAGEIGGWLLNGDLSVAKLLAFTETLDSANKATCIEAVEYATKKQPVIANEALFTFVTTALKDDEPRIKWESARVIGNIAGLFPAQLSQTLDNLLDNAHHSGTVVRWATAYAISQILKLKTENNKKLLPKTKVLLEKETDAGVQKIYAAALRKVEK